MYPKNCLLLSLLVVVIVVLLSSFKDSVCLNNLSVALQAPYMIYVEVLCTSGNGDDPFPTKQFQPTLRQTR